MQRGCGAELECVEEERSECNEGKRRARARKRGKVIGQTGEDRIRAQLSVLRTEKTAREGRRRTDRKVQTSSEADEQIEETVAKTVVERKVEGHRTMQEREKHTGVLEQD